MLMLKNYVFQLHVCVNLRLHEYVHDRDQKKFIRCKFKWFHNNTLLEK